MTFLSLWNKIFASIITASVMTSGAAAVGTAAHSLVKAPLSPTIIETRIGSYQKRLDNLTRSLDTAEGKISPDALAASPDTDVRATLSSISDDFSSLRSAATFADQTAVLLKITSDFKAASVKVTAYVKLLRSSAPKKPAGSGSTATTTKPTVPNAPKPLVLSPIRQIRTSLQLKWTGGESPYALATSTSEQGPWNTLPTNPIKSISFSYPLPASTPAGTSICFEVTDSLQTVSAPACWTASSFSVSGTGTGSSGGTAETGGAGGVAIPVSGLKASNITAHNDTLSWKPVVGAASYAVYRNGVLDDSVTAPAFSEIGPILLPETKYVYTIVPNDGSSTALPFLAIKDTSPQPKTWFAAAFEWLFSTPSADAKEPKYSSYTVTTAKSPDIPKSGTLSVLVIPIALDPGFTNALDPSAANGLPDDPNKINNELFNDTDSVRNFYLDSSSGMLTLNGSVAEPVKIELKKINGSDRISAAVGYPDGTKTGYVDFLLNNDTVSDFRVMNFSFVREDLNKAYLLLNPDQKDAFGKYHVIVYAFPKMKSVQSLQGMTGNIPDVAAEIQRNTITMNGPQKARIFAHELGHVLGLSHAKTIDCLSEKDQILTECTVDEYGDRFDAMGSDYVALDSARRFDLKWLTLTNIPQGQTGFYFAGSTDQRGRTYEIDQSNGVKAYIEFRSKKNSPDWSSAFGPHVNIGHVAYRLPKSKFNIFPLSTFEISPASFKSDLYPELYSLKKYKTPSKVPIDDGGSPTTILISTPDKDDWTLEPVSKIENGTPNDGMLFLLAFEKIPTLTVAPGKNGAAGSVDLSWTPVPPAGNFTGLPAPFQASSDVMYEVTASDATGKNSASIYKGPLHEAANPLNFRIDAGSTRLFKIRAYYTFSFSGLVGGLVDSLKSTEEEFLYLDFSKPVSYTDKSQPTTTTGCPSYQVVNSQGVCIGIPD